MHSAEHTTPGHRMQPGTLIQALLLSAAYTGTVALALFLLHAEGPAALLLSWTTVLALLCFFTRKKIGPLRAIQLLFRAVLVCSILVVLLQLSAAQRSFAEAWLEAARNGAPFGFFSFFACELYALVLFLPLYLVCGQKYAAALTTYMAGSICAAGIVTSQQLVLCASLLPPAVFVIHQKKWQPFIVPVLAAGACSLLSALGGSVSRTSIADFVSLDTTRLMAAIAPEFPLLANLPGYGSSLQAEKPVYQANLPRRPIFSVQGKPFTEYYLATKRYETWNGSEWSLYFSINGSRKVSTFFGERLPQAAQPAETVPEQALSLTLQDDFLAVIPITPGTAAVSLPADCADARISLTDSQVLAVYPSLMRGAEIRLYEQEAGSLRGQPEAAPEFNEARLSIIPGRIRELAATLGAAEGAHAMDAEAQRAYIARVLTYLQDGFMYSLASPQAPKGEDPYEYFLFTSQTGFCTWYAGSFTLLMHAAGIPCRMAEGYRLVTDAEGHGTITGMQMHAWPEVYLDGAWQVYEPTAVFTTKNPIPYIRKGDKKTAAYLAEISGMTQEPARIPEEEKNTTARSMAAVCAAIFLLAAAAFLMLRCISAGSLVRRARHAVKVYGKKGISPPSVTGWLAWKAAVRETECCTEKELRFREAALLLADQMIGHLYGRSTP